MGEQRDNMSPAPVLLRSHAAQFDTTAKTPAQTSVPKLLPHQTSVTKLLPHHVDDVAVLHVHLHRRMVCVEPLPVKEEPHPLGG